MSQEIKVGDMVKHVFKKTIYKVLEVKKEPTMADKMKDLLSDDGFKNLRCLSENNQRGWLSSEEVEKIRK